MSPSSQEVAMDDFNKLPCELLRIIFELSLPPHWGVKREEWYLKTASFNQQPPHMLDTILLHSVPPQGLDSDEFDLGRYPRRLLELASVCKHWAKFLSDGSFRKQLECQVDQKFVYEDPTNLCDYIDRWFLGTGNERALTFSMGSSTLYDPDASFQRDSRLFYKPKTHYIFEYLTGGSKGWEKLRFENSTRGHEAIEWPFLRGLIECAELQSNSGEPCWKGLKTLEFISPGTRFDKGDFPPFSLHRIAPDLQHIRIECDTLLDTSLASIFYPSPLQADDAYKNLTTFEWTGTLGADSPFQPRTGMLRFLFQILSWSPKLETLKILHGSKTEGFDESSEYYSWRNTIQHQHNSLQKLELHWTCNTAFFLGNIRLPRLKLLSLSLPQCPYPEPGSTEPLEVDMPVSAALRQLVDASSRAAEDAKRDPFGITDLHLKWVPVQEGDLCETLKLVRDAVEKTHLRETAWWWKPPEEKFFPMLEDLLREPPLLSKPEESIEEPPLFPKLVAFGMIRAWKHYHTQIKDDKKPLEFAKWPTNWWEKARRTLDDDYARYTRQIRAAYHARRENRAPLGLQLEDVPAEALLQSEVERGDVYDGDGQLSRGALVGGGGGESRLTFGSDGLSDATLSDLSASQGNSREPDFGTVDDVKRAGGGLFGFALGTSGRA